MIDTVRRHQVLVPLLDRREPAWREMVETIQAELPAYRCFGSPEEEREWADGIRMNLQLFLELVTDDRWFTPLEAEAVRTIGGRRYDQEVDVAVIRASVRIAIRVARSWVVRSYAPVEPGDREAMDEVLDALHRYGGEVEDLLEEGWVRRRRQCEADSERAATALVEETLAGEVADWDEFAKRADAVGCDATVPRGLVLLQGAEDGGLSATTGLDGVLVAARPNAAVPHVVLLVPAAPPGEWSRIVDVLKARARRQGTTLLVAGPCLDPADVHNRYEEAIPLIPYLARLQRLGEGPAVHLHELGLCPVVAALQSAARARLRRAVPGRLGYLDADERARLLDVVGLHVRLGFRASAVADETGWNIKTVYDRRSRIEAATGLSFTDPSDQALLALGWSAWVLDGGEPV